MTDIKLAINSARAERLLRKLHPIVRESVEKTMESVGSWGKRHVKGDFLNGPRPRRLRQDTGKLYKSIKYSVEKSGNNFLTHIGTNVLSKKGFNYPEYWEYRGTKHGGPRPFLHPLLDEKGRDLQNVFNMVLRKEILIKLAREK